MPTLFIVPTPIGNLEDITLRALRILREAALIAAEDTRTTRVLLQHYQITTPLTSYHEHNKLAKLDAIFDALQSGDVALVSDAGTPAISDPGYELVRHAIEQGIRVEPLPGASAIITALVGSGLPTDGFVYLGFLPRKDRALRDFLTSLATERRTLVAYESPNRLVDTLKAIESVLGDRQVCVARELSKKFEEFQRGPASAVLAHFEATAPRGEIVLLIAGAAEVEPTIWDEAQVRAALRQRLDAGEPLSSAARAVATAAGWERRAVYSLGIEDD
ncbi:MAG: 16S rRNA (cytidine(1402)-2'-O)-methyltransferase [Chloroflexi bacterium]|nr:16S rRNA (cytidine(1402)-2'-O)-methyltransferase [Chloroflexota bacterium]MCC6894020.1 16S rRNA (cytidine(1402)-2'-O)-methyltransferase [Anaerolineae bacterium]